MATETLTWGTLPEAKTINTHGAFPMTIRDKDEWKLVAAVVNQGIDSHLEAVFCQADASTGEITIEARSLHTFLRRLVEVANEDWGDDPEAIEESRMAGDLASSIMTCLGYEWV